MLDLLVLPSQDFRALCHESNTTKHDEFTILLIRSESRKAEGVPLEVCKIDHFLPLVVMTEYDQTVSKGLLPAPYSPPKLSFFYLAIGRRQ
jgi:hypothetical protein